MFEFKTPKWCDVITKLTQKLREKSNQIFIAPFVTFLECSMLIVSPMLWFISQTASSSCSHPVRKSGWLMVLLFVPTDLLQFNKSFCAALRHTRISPSRHPEKNLAKELFLAENSFEHASLHMLRRKKYWNAEHCEEWEIYCVHVSFLNNSRKGKMI